MINENIKKIDSILINVFSLKEGELHDNLTMKDIGRWDSLTHMDLISSLEEGLSIEFSMDEIMLMTDIKTIKEIALKRITD